MSAYLDRFGRWLRLAFACLALVAAGGAPARAQAQADVPVSGFVVRLQAAARVRTASLQRQSAQLPLPRARRIPVWDPLKLRGGVPEARPPGPARKLYLFHAALLR
ncbi:MAG: hypothetical protein HY901_09155 [Deltaproteobacteria bacterium]|nr:hypothetical protein [Deltaproteobacteria bacterium]